MLCVISFLMIFITIIQLESGDITNWQAALYGLYSLLMFYHTSKPYWNYEETKNIKKKGE